MNSTKNKRQISKNETFNKIVSATKFIFVRKGILNASTLEIAKKAGVAHGTIFAHFENKNILFVQFFREESKMIAEKLHVLTCDKDVRLKELLNKYLNALIEDEELYVIIAKEFPFYKEEIQREILSTENIIKKMIFTKIEDGIKRGIYSEVNISMAVSYFFGTINYYLSRKDVLVENGKSVLRQYKGQIIHIFYQILTNNVSNYGKEM